ncbi:2-dehydro-3-deoxygalactonokinase [Pseudoduganella namucuonensis]|uniref:2-keto-3-deoxy-galactonokinase n=1 Tax=Pseudoduganella namucuonensis TaxID=1035707 RepID=A0A1I7M3C6_9BURK|nr:2-dehydro-3-deoxygalactonokinase [Pseudoduganella namucuonensis]SFV16461.1 2-keto-3-deoxy-galactonokinase [Pseudoduganella namucuonensis]
MGNDQGGRKLVGIDWGTTNRRAYVLDGSGACLRSHGDGLGLLAVREHLGGRFDEALLSLLDELDAGPDPKVLMSGMVGSAQGWQEAPYLDCSVPLEALRGAAVPVRGAPEGRDWRIVPGYCCRHGEIDVMRGEEIQLLGALALGHGDGWVVLPGTHSKWVLLCHGRVAKLATYMTGELFAMLSSGGTLAQVMAASGGARHARAADDAAGAAGVLADAADADDSGAGAGAGAGANAAAAAARAGLFAGAMRAQRREALSHALFGVRASVVAGAMPAAQARSCVSGLLIGAEFSAALAMPGEGAGDRRAEKACQAGAVRLIASPALGELYAQVAEMYNVRVIMLEPDVVYCAALAQFLPGG